MKQQTAVKKLAIASLLTAVAVVGSLFSFPVLGSRCSPVQHMVNILCAVFLGPWYGLASAFAASLLRNLLGLGTLLAFPGSMVGALVCGLTYAGTRNLGATCVGEVFGTGILGGLAAWPIATLILGQTAAVYGYMGPFLISTIGGSVIAGVVLFALKRSGGLDVMQTVVRR
ncbi:energy coupling factor transporter S component ThiW [Flavonifractor sp. An82]|uniref:energy coupling factor transporter S component ThiW n=1 Tax=Flavonifractor sp. An82 TaxID=1965660 RepID=UPI000B36EA39|nr:energy coupling factor transporter S component ThiW [Flavonifractor sp. An82]OUN19066.1 energy coupling factor transporter S component ThiW [Flavonifractor sp. An82]